MAIKVLFFFFCFYPNQTNKEGIDSGFCTSGLSCKAIMTSLEYRMTDDFVSSVDMLLLLNRKRERKK